MELESEKKPTMKKIGYLKDSLLFKTRVVQDFMSTSLFADVIPQILSKPFFGADLDLHTLTQQNWHLFNMFTRCVGAKKLRYPGFLGANTHFMCEVDKFPSIDGLMASLYVDYRFGPEQKTYAETLLSEVEAEDPLELDQGVQTFREFLRALISSRFGFFLPVSGAKGSLAFEELFTGRKVFLKMEGALGTPQGGFCLGFRPITFSEKRENLSTFLGGGFFLIAGEHLRFFQKFLEFERLRYLNMKELRDGQERPDLTHFYERLMCEGYPYVSSLLKDFFVGEVSTFKSDLARIKELNRKGALPFDFFDLAPTD